MTIVVELVIVNVAIAATQQQPGFGVNILPWSLITYGLLSGCFMLLGGWLAHIPGGGRVAPPTSTAGRLVAGSQEGVMVTPDAAMCFTLGGSGAQTWPPAACCPGCCARALTA